MTHYFDTRTSFKNATWYLRTPKHHAYDTSSRCSLAVHATPRSIYNHRSTQNNTQSPLSLRFLPILVILLKSACIDPYAQKPHTQATSPTFRRTQPEPLQLRIQPLAHLQRPPLNTSHTPRPRARTAYTASIARRRTSYRKVTAYLPLTAYFPLTSYFPLTPNLPVK